jgi:hypothetical protein
MLVQVCLNIHQFPSCNLILTRCRLLQAAEDPAIHNKEDDDDAHPHDGPLELEVSEIVNNSSPKVTFYAQTKKAQLLVQL